MKIQKVIPFIMLTTALTIAFSVRDIPDSEASVNCPINPPKHLTQIFIDAANEYDQSHGLTICELVAQDYFESAFDPSARSPAGAIGIAQFEPETAKELGIDPLDPEQAIHAQAAYMSRLMHVWHRHTKRIERVRLALASYNWGIGNMLKSQSTYKWDTWEEAFPHLPIETQNYVSKIMRNS